MAVKVTPNEDPSTKAKRFVIGDRRAVTGLLRIPQDKYVTGGFSISPAELGFDKNITRMVVGFDKGATLIPVIERVSDTEVKLKLFKALGAELDNESETAKATDFPFTAIGE